MKLRATIGLGLLGIGALLACSKSGGSSNPASSGGALNSAGSGNGSGSSAASPATAQAAITGDYWPSGYWLGYDGTTQFSLLLPGGRGGASYTVADPSVASLAPVSFTISQATHDALWASCLKINPNAESTLFERLYGVGTTVTSYKLTGLKAGQTTMSRAAKAGSNFAPPGGGSGVRVIFVTNYPANAVALGKARYNNTPAVATATNPACGPECHGDAAHGAPNHALGQVETIPDVAVAQWITTGKLPFISLDAQADKGISHTWTFASPDEETGTIAYLRTLQASNYEELLTLEFQSDSQASQICSLKGPPGVGAGSASGTP